MTDSAESWKFMLYHTNSLQLCQTAGIQKAGESVVSTENAQDEHPSSTSLPKHSNLYLISSLLLPAICLLCKKRCSPSWAASCEPQEHPIKKPQREAPILHQCNSLIQRNIFNTG